MESLQYIYTYIQHIFIFCEKKKHKVARRLIRFKKEISSDSTLSIFEMHQVPNYKLKNCLKSMLSGSLPCERAEIIKMCRFVM